MSGPTETSSAAANMEYDVLFYKRALAGKVRRDKGVAKSDGCLTVDSVTGRVALRETCGDDENAIESENEDDDDQKVKKLSWNKRRALQQSKQKIRTSEKVLFASIVREFSQCALQIDDVISLGSYDVEIIALRQPSASATTGTSHLARHTLKSVTPMSVSNRTMASVPLQSKRTGQVATRVVNHSSVPLVSKREWSSVKPSAVAGKVPPKQPATATTTVNTTSILPLKRKAPVAPNIKATETKGRQLADPLAESLDTISTNGTNQALGHIPLPGSIRGALRPHQIDAVNFLWCRLNEKKGCILGDEMGLGKTLMTIACLTALHRRNREKQFVVVCPSSLVSNWANEFDKWLGKACQPKRVVIHKGAQEGLSQLRAYTQKMKQRLKHQPGQVLIVSYELFRRNANEFSFPSGQTVGLLICDESHLLKSASGTTQTLGALESLPADVRLCITATPIQNNLSEFYSLATFCCPGVLGSDLAEFRKYFERPIAAANQRNASSEQLALGRTRSKELEELSKTFMLRRLQKDVLTSLLPPRSVILLFCRPSTRQCQLYRALTQGKCAGGNSMADALTTLTSLRQLCSHPFCHETKAFATGNRGLSNDNPNGLTLSGKLVVLNELVTQIRLHAPDDKVVIVSNFTSALSIIESLILEPRQLSFVRLDGTTKDRQAIVDTFNRTSADANFCFLISSKAGGCGLNIVGANRLVMFDADWNPSTDIQAMGRIYRQGQTKPCTIYRLFTSGTVEEIIYQRQSQKGGLTALTLDAGTCSTGDISKPSVGYTAEFSREEIADCFLLKDCACDTKQKVGNRWPSYDGTSSGLLALGCSDKPLLALAQVGSDTLRFVHVVGNEASNVTDGTITQNLGGQRGYNTDDDSENELDG